MKSVVFNLLRANSDLMPFLRIFFNISEYLKEKLRGMLKIVIIFFHYFKVIEN